MEQTNQPKQTTTPQQAAQPPKKQRRVGTFTFGLVLIAAGVLTILFLLVPGFDLLGIIKFSPVVLIILGGEVLIYAAKPGVTVKYDFLSMLACAFVLVVVGGASLVAYLGLNFGPAYELNKTQLENTVTNQVYAALNTDAALKETVNTADAYVQLNRAVGNTDGTAATLAAGDSCTLSVELLPAKVPDVTAFAEAAQKVVAAVNAAGVPVTEYSFHATGTQAEGETTQSFKLSGDAVWLTGMTAAQLAERTECQYYAGTDKFESAAERDNFFKQQTRDKIVEEYQNAHDGEYPGDEYIAQKMEERFAAQPTPATPETAQ